MTAMVADALPVLSERLRVATGPLHRQVESTPFVRALLRGTVTREAYALLLRSLHAIYAALESGLEAHARRAAIEPVFDPLLRRREALEQDLRFLHGTGWDTDLAARPEAMAYEGHLRALAQSWPDGLVAHAYVRYLGDLSGGQALRKVVQRAYGLAGDDGTAFYDFGPAPRAADLARAFRTGLDKVPGTPHELTRIVEEACCSFHLHDRLFAGLETGHAANG